MFIFSLLLIVTGAIVRNVLTIHSTAVDVRQVGSILIAAGIGALVLKLAALVLRGNRRASVPAGTEGSPDRPDAPRPPMPKRRADTYRSTTAPRNTGDWTNPYSVTNPNSAQDRHHRMQQQIDRRR